MSVDLHRLQVEITAEIKNFKKKCDAVKAEAKKTVSAANKDLSRIGDAGMSSQAVAQLNAVKKQTQAIANQAKAFAKQAKIDAGLMEPTKEYTALSQSIQKAEAEVDKLKVKQSDLSDKDARVMTKGYSACADQVAKTEKRLDGLIEKQIKWAELGESVTGSAAFQRLEKDIEAANLELKKYQNRMVQMEASGRAYSPSEKFLGLQRQIQAAREQVKRYQAEQGQMASAGTDYAPTKNVSGGQAAKAYAVAGKRTLGNVAVEAAKVHPALQKAMALAQKFGNVSRKAFKGAGTAARGLAAPLRVSVSWLKKLASGFGKVYQKCRQLISGLRKASSSMGGLGQSCSKLTGKFGALRITATYMLASFMIMGALNGMKEGFKSLSQYSAKTNSDLSMLMSSLIQLRNSLATAFAPILSVVAPILNTLIGWLTSATTAIAHFFAALTGQSKVVVAKKVNQDFAGSLEGAGDAADDANKKAEKYKKTLLGFDQINKLDAPDEEKKSNSGGALSPGDMFETVEVDNKWASWADKIKEAWAMADFTEIGELLGNKLNSALSSIPWDKIKAAARKIAMSIATFLNGFIAATNWKLVGGTFAEGINTVIEFAYTFVTTFNWKKFGTAIGSAINGFFAKLDLAKAGKTLSEGVKGVLDTAINLATTIDWSQIGQKIADFICNIDWLNVAKKIVTLLGSAIIGELTMLDSFIDKVKDYLVEYIQSGDFWKDVFDLAGTVIEIAIVLVRSGWKTIQTFIGALVEIGVALVKSGWKLLSDFIGNKVTAAISLIKEKWSTLKAFVGDKVSAAVSLIKKGWSSLKSYVGSKVSAAVSLAKSGWSKLTSWIGTNKTLKAGISLIKNGWTSLKKWVFGGLETLRLKFGLPKIGIKWGSKEFMGFKISYPNGFYTYAKGGFPEEGPFMMNRGEIAGKFSNGKSVVANNQQITDGIANAVYRAEMAVRASGGSSSITPAHLNAAIMQLVSSLDRISFYIGDEQIARSNARGQLQIDRRFNPVIG